MVVFNKKDIKRRGNKSLIILLLAVISAILFIGAILGLANAMFAAAIVSSPPRKSAAILCLVQFVPYRRRVKN